MSATDRPDVPAPAVDRALDALAAEAPPNLPELSAVLEAELASIAPVSPRRPIRQLGMFVAASLVYAGLLLAFLSLRADLSGLPMAWILGAGIAWFTGFSLATYFALVPARGTMRPRWRAALAITAVTSIAFIALGLDMHPSVPGVSLDYGMPRLLHGHGCLWLGLATALVPVVLGAIFLRGAVPVFSRWIAATLGAAGGCLGGLLLHMHCRIADGPHIGIIHGGVVVVAAALAALLVPRATDRPFK
ncbi:MAG: NrsF family protein [Deltaproteobacteria bacterium]